MDARQAFNRAGGGNSIASMLLDLLGGGRIQHKPSLAPTVPYYAVYFQDDWRINQRLTLNLGLRWDSDRPTTERFNRTSWFDGNAIFIPAQALRAISRATWSSPINRFPRRISPSAWFEFPVRIPLREGQAMPELGPIEPRGGQLERQRHSVSREPSKTQAARFIPNAKVMVEHVESWGPSGGGPLHLDDSLSPVGPHGFVHLQDHVVPGVKQHPLAYSLDGV